MKQKPQVLGQIQGTQESPRKNLRTLGFFIDKDGDFLRK